MISETPASRAASENGPITPANTGRSVMRVSAISIASRNTPVRPAPTAGTARSRAPSSSSATAPVTVGTSSSETRIGAPKASASTERSIRLTAAAESTRCATSSMPRACVCASEISSRTLTCMSCTAGNERIGSAFFAGASHSPASHSFMLRFI